MMVEVAFGRNLSPGLSLDGRRQPARVQYSYHWLNSAFVSLTSHIQEFMVQYDRDCTAVFLGLRPMTTL